MSAAEVGSRVETATTTAPVVIPALLTLALIRRHYLPLGQRTIFRMISAGKFPKADVSMGAKVRLWKRGTVEQWIGNQERAA